MPASQPLRSAFAGFHSSLHHLLPTLQLHDRGILGQPSFLKRRQLYLQRYSALPFRMIGWFQINELFPICPHLGYKGCNVHWVSTIFVLPLETVCNTRQMPFQMLVKTLHKQYLALEGLAVHTCGFEVALALIHGAL